MKTIRLTSIFFLLILAACMPAGKASTPVVPTADTSQAVEATPTPAVTLAAGSKLFHIVPGESTASYEVAETFINQNNKLNVAVGVTGQVSGDVTANLANPPDTTIGSITIDLSQLKSDSGRHDNAIRNNWLESARFPLAVFAPTRIEGLPTSYTEGQDYSFKVTGNLTVHDTTREVSFDVTARLQGDTLSGTAVSTIKMSDFGIGPISLVGILKTEDQAKLTLKFIARP